MVSGALTKFRRAVGVDTLDVNSTESTDAAGETTQQTNARVGKYVTDKVYLEVEQGPHREHQQGARAGGSHPEALGRQLRERPVSDRRRPAMALRLLRAAGAALGLPALATGR